ncbi:MAG: hypothetical protein Kow0077_17690 [Anaerolineae bacterium]
MTFYADEIARLQAEIETRQSELADLEAEVVDLRQQLAGFEERYNRQVAPLETRLQAVNEAIAELENRHHHRLPHPLGDDNPMEDFWQPPEGYVPVEEQFRRTWHPDPDPEPRDTATTIRPRGTTLSPNETNIKKLYRMLARRYHPDLATDPDERSQRNDLMAQINDAYARRDLGALQTLARMPEDARFTQSLDALRVEELRQIAAQLRERIARLRLEKAEIQHSDMLRLAIEDKLASSRGHDLLAEMVLQLEREYDAAMLKLERLRRSQ